jgi:hypothetical protein
MAKKQKVNIKEEITPLLAKVKNGAIVGQDHGFCKFEDTDTIFKVLEFNDKRKKLIATGYGDLSKENAYGKGAIYAYVKDLIFLVPTEID